MPSKKEEAVSTHLKGHVAVVTGAGRGIGRAIALVLAEEGARVVVNDLGADPENRAVGSRDPADEVVSEIEAAGGSALASYDSVADFDAAERIVRTAVQAFGRLDTLVNVAGNVRDGTIFSLSAEDWHAMLDVHLHGTFNTCRHAAPIMAAQGRGRIVNTISSTFVGSIGAPAYAAAKAGVFGLTKAIATEGARAGITANCFAPGAATRLHLRARNHFETLWKSGKIDDRMWESYNSIPPAEYAVPVVAYLATDAAAHLTGRIFTGTGGKIAIWADPEESRMIWMDHRERQPWTVDELIRLVPGSLAPEPERPQ
jgi:NAD(P)-dependent dehydrogenase (short-subunit alcohol dehydrogenase family)